MSDIGENRIASDNEDAFDRLLVERAIEGRRKALEDLVGRHQPFVFNIALKMFGSHADAEDLTQEVFVKVITSLTSFRGGSSLRTWLYRITVNHFLKTRRRQREIAVSDFETFFDDVAAVEAMPPAASLGITDETVEELRLRCTSGMLMCLDRSQRITFILGAIFNVPHDVAADILGIKAGNYRVRLHRARKDLHSWMQSRCGLVNTANPCRCRNKTSGYVKLGLVDPKRLVFNAEYAHRIDAFAKRGAAGAMARVEALQEEAFLSHPFAATKVDVVGAILGDRTLRAFFALDATSSPRI